VVFVHRLVGVVLRDDPQVLDANVLNPPRPSILGDGRAAVLGVDGRRDRRIEREHIALDCHNPPVPPHVARPRPPTDAEGIAPQFAHPLPRAWPRNQHRIADGEPGGRTHRHVERAHGDVIVGDRDGAAFDSAVVDAGDANDRPPIVARRHERRPALEGSGASQHNARRCDPQVPGNLELA
jgi:hypothetical protein